MSNDLRELSYDLAVLGCPTDNGACFYCGQPDAARDLEDKMPVIDHLPDCPWPSFEEEANA